MLSNVIWVFEWCSRQDLHPRPSRSKRAALICCATGAESDSPSGHGAVLLPSCCRRPAVYAGDDPALLLGSRPQRKGRKWMPHLESHQDLRFQRPSCYCCTTGQESGVARLPKRQSGHDLLALLYPDVISLGDGEAQSPRIISLAASESSQRA